MSSKALCLKVLGCCTSVETKTTRKQLISRRGETINGETVKDLPKQNFLDLGQMESHVVVESFKLSTSLDLACVFARLYTWHVHARTAGVRFSKGPETFRARKPIFCYLYLKPEKHIGPKLYVKGTSVNVKNIMALNSSVIIRFEILLWLSGCENFPGPSRNGPLVRKSQPRF